MEKKRRPRITRPGSGFSLEERPKVNYPGDLSDNPASEDHQEQQQPEQSTWQDRPKYYDRPKPYYENSASQEGGDDTGTDREQPYERRSWDDRFDRSAGSDDRYYQRNTSYSEFDNNREKTGETGDSTPETGDDRPRWNDDRQPPQQRRDYYDRGSTSYPDRSQEGGYQRREGGYSQDRPYQQRRPYDSDRGGYGQDRPYQPRRDYYDRGSSYNTDRNQEGGYQRREGGYGQDRPYQPRRPYDNNDRSQEGGYQRREGGYGQDRPYQPRRDYYDRGGYGGGADRNQQGGGYQRREGGGYDQDRYPPQRRDYYDRGGYGDRNPQQGGNYPPRTGGYGQDRYQQRGGGGGYGDRSQQGGGYQQRGGGYGQDRYPPRGGGYGQDRYPQRGPGGYGQDRFQKQQKRKPQRRRDDFFVERKPKPGLPSGEGMPLNKYLAHCGISSRRKAVDFIQNGMVTVNGEVKIEPYYRIQAGDVVMVEGNSVQIQERLVYVLLNKPKGVITTTEDDRGRATVLDIVDPHFPERIYPVGRLDRDTTGLIVLTNDGDLAQKLSHPSHNIHKQYRVGLDHPLSEADYDRIVAGVELEDGPVTVNWVRFSEDHPDRDVVELEIIVGRNRVVRRLFESLGYQVRKLDRFYFAGLTKKDLPRGSFRELTQREVIMLKHFTGHPMSQKRKRYLQSLEERAEGGTEEDFTGEEEDLLEMEGELQLPAMETQNEPFVDPDLDEFNSDDDDFDERESEDDEKPDRKDD